MPEVKFPNTDLQKLIHRDIEAARSALQDLYSHAKLYQTENGNMGAFVIAAERAKFHVDRLNQMLRLMNDVATTFGTWTKPTL